MYRCQCELIINNLSPLYTTAVSEESEYKYVI